MKKNKGGAPKGAKNGSSKLTVSQVLRMRELYASGRLNQAELADMYGVTRLHVNKIINKTYWRDVK